MSYEFAPIGILRSDFRERFGTPRQPGLVTASRASLALGPEYRDAVRGLEGFSHVWLVFVFHEQEAGAWKPTVRPPRLGGARRVGVFATRSPHRPNPLGISAVRLEGVRETEEGVVLELGGVDLVDGTPVLDVKPYLAYSDSIADARAGWTEEEPAPRAMAVRFSPEAAEVCAREPRLESVVRQMLALDPRPAHQRDEDARYAARLMDFDVRWEHRGGECVVTAIC
jgi:tRNA-Thr(GGU) m(6)t(6)A37 methyltransferase TsaA